MTPEFNGDKSEYAARGTSNDSCDKNWDEIMQDFHGVATLSQFNQANESAQAAYHSCFGNVVLPIDSLDRSLVRCDIKIYLNTEAMLHYFYLLYQLDWTGVRGYNINDYDDEHGFEGESWVCFEEFIGAEFTDKEYMRVILDNNDFALWCTHLGLSNEGE